MEVGAAAATNSLPVKGRADGSGLLLSQQQRPGHRPPPAPRTHSGHPLHDEAWPGPAGHEASQVWPSPWGALATEGTAGNSAPRKKLEGQGSSKTAEEGP